MEPRAVAFPDMALGLDGAGTPQAAAAAVTRASASNLWAVGRALPAAKRRLFEAAYATMRVVDDFVDDSFLTMPAGDRAALRAPAQAAVTRWLTRCKAALAGEGGASARDDAGDPLEAAGAGRLYAALAGAAAAGAPDPGPWRRLAAAMQHDVAEAPLPDWDAFRSYCEGATVAPASVFLFVLTAAERDGRLVCSRDDAALQTAARPMAVFCYLVHILRDLARDAARGGQIVTLPTDLLAEAGLDRDGLAAAAAADSPAARRLAATLAERARAELAGARAVQAELEGELAARERAVLGALLAIYETLFERLAAAPGAALTGDGRTADGVRAAVFRRFGLEGAES